MKRLLRKEWVVAVLAALVVAISAIGASLLLGAWSADTSSSTASWPSWVAGAVSVVGLVAALTGWRENARRLGRKVTYRDRITEVKENLTRTSLLLSALEDDLATRTRLLEKAQADAERYEKLASLNAEQAKAVEDLVGRQFERQGRANAYYWWAGIVVAFVLGIVVNAITPTVLSWFS